MNIPLLIVILYVLLLFCISIYVSCSQKKDSENFLLYKGKNNAFVVAASIAFTVGLSAGWYDTAWAIGGMGSVSLTNVLNMVLIYVGVILAAALVLWNHGGWEAIDVLTKADPDTPYLSLTAGMGWMGILSWIVVMLGNTNSVQGVVQIGLTGKSDRSATVGFIVGAILMVPVFKDGKCIYHSPKVMDIQKYCKEELATLWEESLRLEYPHRTHVDLSMPLWKMKNELLDKYHFE